ncbi:hypothetical protein GOBAR_AA27580 [Gossypium barbadense]|uniref:Uncharacterized protein n=1 Tax=Gossypium barbadense TaxID=3634 RepID=A0A2P5WPV9_GOSBA|nr:hypothetical protein GOBAR_AA27580 [Gossypium barbadense]
MADVIRALLTTDPWELFFRIIELTYLKLTMELCSTFHLQTVMSRYDDLGTVQFHLGRLICQLSVPEFGATCWHTLAPSAASCNPSRSKASVLPPSLRYLHAILAHTIIGRRESTGIVNTHDVYFLWCMSQGHVIDLAYLIALAIQHQIEWHRKGLSPQGISSMLSMRMIERHRGTYPSQYCLAQSTEEEAYEDIPDDVPPQHEDPPTQPPPPSRPVHAAASYASKGRVRFQTLGLSTGGLDCRGEIGLFPGHQSGPSQSEDGTLSRVPS